VQRKIFKKKYGSFIFLFIFLSLFLFILDFFDTGLLVHLFFLKHKEFLSFFLYQKILFNLRLPHVLAIILIGFSLGISGAVLQAYFRNDLADPGLMGISAGGSLGSALMLIFFWSSLSLFSYTLGALLGAFLALLILLKFSHSFSTRYQSAALILLGVGLNALLGGLLTFAITFIKTSHLAPLLFWGMGSLQLPSYFLILIGFIFFLLGFFIIFPVLADLDRLNLGERAAFSLGVNLSRLRVRVLLALAFWIGISVLLSGPIAFIGLLAPHFARRVFGASSNQILLWGSGLFGIFWLLLSDVLVSFYTSTALPIGVACSLLGGPAFIYLLWYKLIHKPMGLTSC